MATTAPNVSVPPVANNHPQAPPPPQQPHPVIASSSTDSAATVPQPAATPTPSATPKPAATPNQTPAKQPLSDERVSEIGWFFIKSYYDFFVSKLNEIHKIYHPQASINHDSFPETESLSSLNDKSNGKLPIAYKARGIEAIKETYSKYLSGSKNNRIVITSACFQLSLNQNIIIVVFGEWSTSDQPYKQFTQTFVLVPGRNEANYEVANDILRFVIVNGYKEKHEQKQEKEITSETVVKKITTTTTTTTTATTTGSRTATPTAAPTITSTTSAVEQTTQKPRGHEQEVVSNNVAPTPKEEQTIPVANGSKEETKKEVDVVEAKKPAETQPEEKQPAKPDSIKPEPVKQESVKAEAVKEKSVPQEPNQEEEREPVKETKPEVKPQEPVEAVKEEPAAAEEPKKEPTKTSPPQPMSWAALAQQSVPAKPTTKPVSSPPVTKVSATAASAAGVVKKPVSSASSASTNSTQSNGKYKKEDWYPIYIRGIRHIEEKELKDHLSKKFGELKFFKVHENIALVDFVNQEAQHKALDAKETTLKGITIALEPRESKTANSYHNSSSGGGNNGNYKKYGGQGKSSNKNKDKFDNKKVNGGKKNINKPVAKP